MWQLWFVRILSVQCLLSSLHTVAGTPVQTNLDWQPQTRRLNQYEEASYALDVPVYDRREGYVKGPVDPVVLETKGQCLTIGEVLDMIPDASIWKQVMIDAGMKIVLLNDPKVQTTLLVPINEAFFEPLEDDTFGVDMADLITTRPDIINSLVGATVLKGLYPANTLAPGEIIPTSNTIDKVNPLTIEAAQGPILKAQGSSAAIVAQDIAACGPSVIHLIDTVLLPFRFDDEPRDAITGTQTGVERVQPIEQNTPVSPPEQQQPVQQVPPKSPEPQVAQTPSSTVFSRIPFGRFFG